jgi:hypothetical protein
MVETAFFLERCLMKKNHGHSLAERHNMMAISGGYP